MTIQISISAHATGANNDEQEANEKAMIAAAREMVASLGQHGEVYGGQASTQHHGVVNLRDAPQVVDGSPDTPIA